MFAPNRRRNVHVLVSGMAAGCLGGCLALALSSGPGTEGFVKLLMSCCELALAAEKSCERLIAERRKLEELAAIPKESHTGTASAGGGLPNRQETQSAPLEIAYSKEQPKNAKPKVWDQVMVLAQQGMNCAEIAQALDVGQGEVNLVLNLHRQLNNTNEADNVSCR